MTSCRALTASFLALSCFAAGPALAQSAASAFPPSFSTLDRVDGRSLVGADLGFTFADGVSSQRLGVFGQAVSDAGIGGYGAIALAHASIDGAGPISDQSRSGPGNLEGGVVFALRNLLTFRLGLVLPTSSSDGTLANMIGTYARLTDMVQATHDYTWLRLSASPIVRSGTFFMRVDLGLDVPMSKPNGADSDPLIRGNLGLGWDGGVVSLTGELVNIGTTGGDYSLGRRFVHTAAVAARLSFGEWQPSLALIKPLDESLRDHIDLIMLFGLQVLVR